MPVFTSNRERRLWLWTLAVVVGIYSTLGVARTLAGILRNKGLLEIAFGFGMLMIIAAIIIQALKKKRSGIEVGVALGVVAVYLLVFTRMAIPEERTHLIEYSMVAAFILEALRERVSQGRHVPAPALLTILGTSLLGAIDECIQAFLPSRVFDPFDILFNILAAVMAVTASVALQWAKRRFN